MTRWQGRARRRALAASHSAVATAPRGRLVSYLRPVPENSPKNQHAADESVDLSAMAREFEPALSGLKELLEPIAQALKRERERLGTALASLAPFAQEIERERERWETVLAPIAQAIEREQRARWDTALAPFAQEIERGRAAENLLEQGWVPNFATPYDLVAECGDDGARLQTSLLDHYTDNWVEVRTQLESRLSSYGIDDEAKATFREALGVHEARFYRAVSRLLFPEFERLFRAALFDGRAGQIRYNEFMEKLVSDEEADHLGLGDFLIAGFQDMVLFKYVTEGVRKPSASADNSRGATPEYVPGLAVRVDETNIARARQSPIPTRHAVVHGLVTYSSQQSSLNAIFIADYVFSVLSVDQRRRQERRDSRSST